MDLSNLVKLKSLYLGYTFDQSLYLLNLVNLTFLTLGHNFYQPSSYSRFPISLTDITVNCHLTKQINFSTLINLKNVTYTS